MTGDEPSPGDYVVFTSGEGGVSRLLLARVLADGSPFAVLTTFEGVAGAHERFADEGCARARREGVRAFRREDDGTFTPLCREPDRDDSLG